MCVGAYLIWGCRAPFRLLGLVVMPLAALLLVLAWAAGGAGKPARSEFGDVFLTFHVGLVLAAFAGFTLAAALAALYLWQERRLKRHSPGVLRLRAPVARDARLADRPHDRRRAAGPDARRRDRPRPARARGGGLRRDHGGDAAHVGVYAAFLVLRYEAGWRGRRTAYLALAGFLLVVLVRLVLTPFAHF